MKKTTRVQLEMPESSMNRLLWIKDETEATSYAEVVKNALQLYEAMIKDRKGGKEFLIKDEDGNVGPYRILL